MNNRRKNMKQLVITLCLLVIALTFSQCVNQDCNTEIKNPYLGQKTPENTPEVFVPEVVSSSENFEIGCTFSTDGKEFYFGRTLDKKAVTYVIKNINGVWTSPEALKISDAQYFTEPHINYEGDQLFFTEFTPSSDPNIRVRGKISTSHKIEGEWSKSKVLWVVCL